MTTQDARRTALRGLCDKHGLSPNDKTTAGEDIAPYLANEISIARFAAVTRNGEIFYVIPDFATFAAAQGRAFEYVNDDIFAEWPVEVVDLDTGDTLVPDFAMVRWWRR